LTRLIHRESGRVLATRVRHCTTVWEQLRGVIGQEPEVGEAFALPNCHQIHTAFIRSPLDIVFCDPAGAILWVGTLPPWRLSPALSAARIVYEAPPGTFAQLPLHDHLITQPEE